MIGRDRLIELGLAIVIFAIASLSLVASTTVVGVLALVLAAIQIGRAQRSEDWAIVDLVFGVLLLLFAGTTLVTPTWGVPLLFIAGGIQLVRALGDVGMAINLALVGVVAFERGAPEWAWGLLVIVAIGKVAWFLREYRRAGSSVETSPA